MNTLFHMIKDNKQSSQKRPEKPHNRKEVLKKTTRRNSQNEQSIQYHLKELEMKYQWEKIYNILLNYSEVDKLTSVLQTDLKNEGQLRKSIKEKNLIDLVENMLRVFNEALKLIKE